MKTAVVLGGGGFIGNHLVNSLKDEGYWVRAVDLKYPEYQKTKADEFIQGDLKESSIVQEALCSPQEAPGGIDEVYQLAADMGGADYIFTGENDANVMHNSAMINLNVAKEAVNYKSKRLFYSSSACMYPEYNQMDPDNPKCAETDAYPAEPDSEYGWEKLFSERLFAAFARNYGLKAYVARYHNVYGPLGTWQGGREKSPAALCRKVAEIPSNILRGTIDVYGDGEQTRSFLYIDDCVEATKRLIRNDSFFGPVNIGSEERISINNFAHLIAEVAGKKINIRNIDGPTGVRGRSSHNALIEAELGWQPRYNLLEGITKLYEWIDSQVSVQKAA